MDRLPPDLSQELAELRARIATLEGERMATRRRGRWVGGAVVLAALVGTVASAANGACPNGLPFCFAPDSPASAPEVNTNFAQLKEWLESKVGTVATPVKITAGATVSAAVSTNTPPTQASRALYVSAVTGGATEPIADFRHDNKTQGIGIGWNAIVATGTNADQDLQLVPKGSGQVVAVGNFTVTGNLIASGSNANCAIGPCYCPAGLSPISWTGTCSNAGIGVYSVASVSLGTQRGFDVQCLNAAFNAVLPMRNLTVICSRLVLP